MTGISPHILITTFNLNGIYFHSKDTDWIDFFKRPKYNTYYILYKYIWYINIIYTHIHTHNKLISPGKTYIDWR